MLELKVNQPFCTGKAPAMVGPSHPPSKREYDRHQRSTTYYPVGIFNPFFLPVFKMSRLSITLPDIEMDSTSHNQIVCHTTIFVH
jgi:hypothetical protein